jgi:GAF domain-containing protein
MSVIDISTRSLLQSVVEIARSVFGAAAASVFTVDSQTGDLIFEAVSGEGEDELIGRRFPGGTGIAGWVAACGQPMRADDVAENPVFSAAAAESTGYLPSSIMAAPLIADGDTIGVLEVLDAGSWPRGELGDVDLLGLLATEVTLGLDLVIRLRRAAAVKPAWSADEKQADLGLLGRLADRLPTADRAVATAVMQLLNAADGLLAPPATDLRE